MHRYSPPRKSRRGLLGEEDFNRRSQSKWDKSDLPPPPDVAGVVTGSVGYINSRLHTSNRHLENLQMSAGEGRGRLDRSEPGHMRSRRSPDRCERREDHYDSYDDDAWDLRSREQPTDTIILKGLPDDFRERDVQDLVHGIRGVKDIRMVTRRRGRDGGPMAFIEFHSVEQCVTAEERWLRDRLDEERLYRASCEFAQPLGSNRVSDWVCTVCKTLNFSRRDECIKCRTDRDWRGHSPTRTICVSNVDPEFTEDDLKILVAEHGVAHDIRLTRSRTGSWAQPHGIAYITFASTEDAKAAKQAITGTLPAGQGSPLETAFAQDRGAQKASMASQAVAAATAMNAYSSSRREDTSGARPGDHGGWKPREIPPEDSEAAAAVPQSDAAAPGFVYDEASGYYYDAGTGYYYDSNTQLYYHPTTLSWYRHNEETGEYDVIPADNAAPTSERSETTAADTGRQLDAAGTARVISSRPQLETQGLLTFTAKVKTATPTGGTAFKPVEKNIKDTGKVDMVSAWLQRKAEEQRKAARDFLKKPEGKSNGPVAGAPDEQDDPVSVAHSGRSTPQQGHAAATTQVADTISKQLAGGVVRGKVYSKKTA